MAAAAARKSVCVTGAGGFVASWLVKLLLSKGHYTVRGTVRNPDDDKNAHLKALEGARERLQLLRADLLDYESVASAVAGCEGVFHVASPVPSTRSTNPEAEVIAPAVNGTLNVLKACDEAKVKRVVVVSSCSAVFNNPNWPKGKVFNEDSWSDEDLCKKNEDWYDLSKTLAERAAFAYAAKTGLDIVTVCPTLIIGPLMQSTVNASSKILLRYFKAYGGGGQHPGSSPPAPARWYAAPSSSLGLLPPRPRPRPLEHRHPPHRRDQSRQTDLRDRTEREGYWFRHRCRRRPRVGVLKLSVF